MPKPILQAGVLTGDELMLYGERDFIGVEEPGAADLRGINAAAGWTRRVKTSALVEHDENGIHSTPRIPRGLCEVLWDYNAGIWVINPDYDSYLMGTYYSEDPSLFTLAAVADGVFDLTLGIAMPSINWGIIDATRPQSIFEAATPRTFKTWAAVTGSVLSTTKIRITRRSGDFGIDGYNGECAFFLCG